MRSLRNYANKEELTLCGSEEKEPMAALVTDPTVAVESQKTKSGYCGLRLLQSLRIVFHQMVLAFRDILDEEARAALASHWGA